MRICQRNVFSHGQWMAMSCDPNTVSLHIANFLAIPSLLLIISIGTFLFLEFLVH